MSRNVPAAGFLGAGKTTLVKAFHRPEIRSRVTVDGVSAVIEEDPAALEAALPGD